MENVATKTTASNTRRIILDILTQLLGALNLAFWKLDSELYILLGDSTLQDRALEKGHLDTYVNAFCASISFAQAGSFSEILELFAANLSDDQLGRITTTAISNSQIYQSFKAQKKIGRILKENKARIDDGSWSELVEKRGSYFETKNSDP